MLARCLNLANFYFKLAEVPVEFLIFSETKS